MDSTCTIQKTKLIHDDALSPVRELRHIVLPWNILRFQNCHTKVSCTVHSHLLVYKFPDDFELGLA